MREFETGEDSRHFPEEEMEGVQDLTNKVWEVIGWDLEKICGTPEERELVEEAQSAMKEIAAMVGITSGGSSENPNQTVPKTFSLEDIQKIRLKLKPIEDVIGWDISTNDEEDARMMEEARESLSKLKDTF